MFRCVWVREINFVEFLVYVLCFVSIIMVVNKIKVCVNSVYVGFFIKMSVIFEIGKIIVIKNVFN